MKIVGDLRSFVDRMVLTMVETTFAEYPAEIREILVRNIIDLSIVRDAANNPGYPNDAARLAIIRRALADNEAWYDEAGDTEGELGDGLSS
jgi:hypothetical protein